MGLIYMRISPSGKYYIGRTINKETDRWNEHVRHAKNHSADGCWLLNQAINKYGGDNFTVKILEDNITDFNQLQEREEYWIKYYDATNPDKGYNRSPGRGGHIAKVIEQYDIEGNFLKEWNNIGEILRYYNWNERNLYDCLSGGYSHFHHYLWKYKDDSTSIEQLIKRYKNNQSRKGNGTIIKCQETGDVFPSIRALERELHISHGKIIKMFQQNNTIEYNNLHYMKEV